MQTCRGSHTNTLVTDPNDRENVYIYVSGSAPVRSPNELAGCIGAPPDSNPNSALFRIEVIQVPVAHPEQARIVSSPRIFNDLTQARSHGETPEDIAAAQHAADSARAAGGFVATINGRDAIVFPGFITQQLDSIMKARGGSVNKFIGDAAMCIWGAPKETLNSERAAVQCALEIQDRAASLSLDRRLYAVYGNLKRVLGVVADSPVWARLHTKACILMCLPRRPTSEGAE